MCIRDSNSVNMHACEHGVNLTGLRGSKIPELAIVVMGRFRMIGESLPSHPHGMNDGPRCCGQCKAFSDDATQPSLSKYSLGYKSADSLLFVSYLDDRVAPTCDLSSCPNLVLSSRRSHCLMLAESMPVCYSLAVACEDICR